MVSPVHIVEAALFSAGRPLAVEEIVERTGLKTKEIEKAVKELQATYKDRDTVLEIGRAGTKWAMQVRTQAAEPAAKFAPMEIAEKLLKTLALIAYHQPMKQSELSDMIGSKVYDHVRELHERGLIKTRAEGVTKILTTTAAFPEYFGLEAATPDEIRQVMGRLVGIEAPPKRKEKRVDSFEAVDGTGDEATAPSRDGPTNASPEEHPVADQGDEAAPPADRSDVAQAVAAALVED